MESGKCDKYDRINAKSDLIDICTRGFTARREKNHLTVQFKFWMFFNPTLYLRRTTDIYFWHFNKIMSKIFGVRQ